MQQIKRALLVLLCLLVFLSFASCTPGGTPPLGGGSAGGETEGAGDTDASQPTADALMRSVMAVECSFINAFGSVYATSDGSAVIICIEADGTAYLLTNYHVLYSAYEAGGVCGSITVAPAGAEQSGAMAAECIWYAKRHLKPP